MPLPPWAGAGKDARGEDGGGSASQAKEEALFDQPLAKGDDRDWGGIGLSRRAASRGSIVLSRRAASREAGSHAAA